ncbi:MAG: (d)CMP kinase [Thermodesulfovibrionales bacterium]|nr:(d)CMP kinase [Thermodesulfovibrionales bacterium]
MKRVIAIDGPSGAGKSTIARLLSERMGFYYLDTGCLYRAIGVYLNEKDVKDTDDDDRIIVTLKSAEIVYDGSSVFINGFNYTDLIRTPLAGHLASVFSARGVIRSFLLEYQRQFGRQYDTVAEGRDMTTVVFPDAWKKFYVDASQEVRANRRFKQMLEMGKPITYDEAFKDVKLRDERDMNRKIAPLKIADDATYIDTTHLTIYEVIDRLISLCKQ